jgi:uncharacterized membrane protein
MTENPSAKSLAELRRLHRPIRNTYDEHRQKMSSLDKLAVWITEHVGTMGFFGIILVWSLMWLAWNILAPVPWQFDPYPAFVLWLFISNFIQILLMPLIMVGQNLQGRHAEMRAEADFEVNVKAELEIETILLHLENQNKLMLGILDRLDKTQQHKT